MHHFSGIYWCNRCICLSTLHFQIIGGGGGGCPTDNLIPINGVGGVQIKGGGVWKISFKSGNSLSLIRSVPNKTKVGAPNKKGRVRQKIQKLISGGGVDYYLELESMYNFLVNTRHWRVNVKRPDVTLHCVTLKYVDLWNRHLSVKSWNIHKIINRVWTAGFCLILFRC